MPVLLVDDEPQVLEILCGELESAGHTVHRASSPAEAANLARELTGSDGRPLIVVADLEMPNSTGRTLEGGLEVAETLAGNAAPAGMVLMAEELSPRARARAKRLGIRKVVFKPTLSKLDSEQYLADLRSFASLLEGLLQEIIWDLVGEERGLKLAAADEPDGLTSNLLTSMREQLANPLRSVAVSKQVLPVAASVSTLQSGSTPKRPNADSSYSGSITRKHERLECLTIEAEFKHGDQVGCGYVIDLSEEGAFLETATLCPVGDLIRLRIFLPSNLGEITAEAKVVRHSDGAGDRGEEPRGMGVSFVELIDESL
jgi:CheY-like chemotaxis protein